MNRTFLLGILTFVFGLVISSGCEKEAPSGVEKGLLKIEITDAPFPFDLIERATFTLIRAEIQPVGSDEDLPRPVLMEKTVTYDLLELRNGVTAMMSESELPAGDYEMIRLYIDKANIVLSTGTTMVLKVPSGPQSGIKAIFDPPLSVEAGKITEALLDFDVASSFILKGNPGTPAGIKGFSFRPVIRTVVMQSTGKLEGFILDQDANPIENAEVWLEQNNEKARTFSNEDGYYAILGISPGIIEITATADDFDTTVVDNVEIFEMTITSQDLSLFPLN